MLSIHFLKHCGVIVLLTTSGAIAHVPASRRASQTCYDTETSALYCYSGPDDTPQDVTVDDITFVAGYLRSYGQQLKGGRFFTMTAADAPDCDEWTLFTRDSVVALAKHIDTAVNSSVLFEDIASTIDGGPSATGAQKQSAIIGCLSDGGSLGVRVNETNPAYNMSTYTSSGYTPNGILIKIVASGE